MPDQPQGNLHFGSGEPIEGRCGALKRQPDPDGVFRHCSLTAGHGTDHLHAGLCKFHGGSTETHRKAGQVELARQEVVRLGGRREIDPAEALLELVWEAAGNVEYFRVLLTSPDTENARRDAVHKLYDAERDRLARYSESCQKLHIEDRLVQLREADGRRIFAAFAAGVERAQLTPEQQEAFRGAVLAALKPA